MIVSGAKRDDLSLAAALSRLERGEEAGADLTGPVPEMVVGLSGPPGVGKSVLTGQLLSRIASQGLRPAVLAVDPSSSRSGGAILGDRMRMQGLGIPTGVFIRSLASRGALGGLSQVVPAALRALGTWGYDLALLETVGVGQNEVDVLGVADTVVVVQSPGAGDEVQALKAGLLEIADVYVLNKNDLAGASAARAVLVDQAMRSAKGDWLPPVVSTCATAGEGVEELWSAIRQHHEWLTRSGALRERRQRQLESELVLAARAELDRRLRKTGLIKRFKAGEITQREALGELFGLIDNS